MEEMGVYGLSVGNQASFGQQTVKTAAIFVTLAFGSGLFCFEGRTSQCQTADIALILECEFQSLRVVVYLR